MAFDAFLKLDGIEGESNDSKHKDEIEISSYSWGVSNAASTAGGAGTGKASFQDFHFTMPMSKASPKLMLACATGKHILSGLITCRRAGESQTEFLKIKLTDVLVSSYLNGGANQGEHTDNVPQDALTLAFVKIDFDYITTSADGKPGETVHADWDVRRNEGG